MERIIINEIDETTANQPVEVTDVAFVPGFSSNDDAPYLIPTLCTSIKDFQEKFGTEPAVFEADQDYPAMGASAAGFPNWAIPVDASSAAIPMFEEDDKDTAYYYALELLRSGMPVVYMKLNQYAETTTGADAHTSDVTVANFYTKLASIYPTTGSGSILDDKNLYRVKYLTSGGYPTFEYFQNSTNAVSFIANGMMAVASTRGDCIALIDHTNKPERVLPVTTNLTSDSVIDKINVAGILSSTDGAYGAMYTPWYNATFPSGNTVMPGSFAYLSALAKSLKSNSNWNSVAGAARGLVPALTSLNTKDVMTSAIAESYQFAIDGDDATSKISINPITYIYPYGYCIWGNRTLYKNEVGQPGYAKNFLNTRNSLCDIKKQLYIAANSLMFEQNTDVLWINFRSLITPLLDKLKANYAISNYKIVRGSTETKTKMKATVTIYPIYAVESFEIDVVISDEDEVSVS